MGNTFDELAALPPNWDNYGARPISPAAIKAARPYYRDIGPMKAQLFPTPDGHVQIEWDCEGFGLEIEFYPDGTASGLIGWDGADTYVEFRSTNMEGGPGEEEADA